MTMTRKSNLGARLKTLRLQRGLTMRELARQAKCSASFLSQLELNRASPSVANLEKICNALKIPVADFLREDTPLTEPMLVSLDPDGRPLAMRWHGARMRHLIPQETPQQFTSLLLTLEVGCEMPPRLSRRSMNQLTVVLRGNVEIIVNNRVFTLAPKEAVFFDLAMVHQYRNIGTDNVEMLLVNPYGFQLFEQEEEDRSWSLRQKKQTQVTA
jgi:transcriptional regulator with XRE-family HTH domain